MKPAEFWIPHSKIRLHRPRDVLWGMGIREGTDTGAGRRTLESTFPGTRPPPTSVTFICRIQSGVIAVFDLLAERIQGYNFCIFSAELRISIHRDYRY